MTAPDTPAAVAAPAAEGATVNLPWAGEGLAVHRFRLSVVEGPGAGTVWVSASDRCALGSHALNDLVLDDPTVSRFHCEITVEPGGARVVDLKSKNGTLVDGLRVVDAYLRDGSTVVLGRARLRFELDREKNRLPLSPSTRFGDLCGTSPGMRAAIALLERAAASDATVLLEGETGTGKGRAAQALHRASARQAGPFVVVDCGAIPGNLLESELFGHEKGAFTGADAQRIGAFEEASGGTLFLDEIGEMPVELQPKLLRALENREVRRLGANRYLPVDLRVVAATNRDLRAEVNAGRFRSDLYYRLAVVKVPMPPLRERPEDLAGIAAALLADLGASAETIARVLAPESLAELTHHAWPGNARELRNHLEARLVIEGDAVSRPAPDEPPAAEADGRVEPFSDARRRAIDAFERRYLDDLMRRFSGKVAQAAQAAGVDRVYLYRLLRRQGRGTK
jgi:DNA-binding NtrC family response regulator